MLKLRKVHVNKKEKYFEKKGRFSAGLAEG